MNSQSVCIKISLLFWRIYSKCTQIVYVCRHVVAIVASILVRSCVPLKVWSDFYIVLHPNFVVFWMTSISFLFHPRTVTVIAWYAAIILIDNWLTGFGFLRILILDFDSCHCYFENCYLSQRNAWRLTGMTLT